MALLLPESAVLLMTEPTDRFLHITSVMENRFGLLKGAGVDDDIWIKLDSAEYDDYLNVMARYRYWQARLGKVAAEA